LVVSYVYIVPLFYLNCVMKGYSRWTRPPQRNGKAFQSPVEVVWIEVQPIRNTTQELMDWSRINSRELACRIILVHVITMIVKVHFTIFIAVIGRRTWNTGSCVGTSNHISISISYAISYTILRTLQKDALWHFDIDTISYTISYKTFDIGYDISNLRLFGYTILVRYRTFLSISITILYPDMRQYRDIQMSNVKPLISYPISVQCRDIQISYFFVRYQSFGRYRIRYVIPGAAGRTGHVPAPPTGPASWSSTRLDGLYSCVTVLTPFPAGDQQLLSVAAVARPWCGLPAGHGGQS
jgi:hypothetical protein